MSNKNEKLGAARQYVDACKKHGPTAERELMHDALYERLGCQIYLDDNEFIKEFRPESALDEPMPSFCKSHHCTERGAWCDKCAYTAFSSSHRRRLDE